MHQKSEQLELLVGGWGEPPSASQSGEARRAAHKKERSGTAGLLIERAVARENAMQALKRVRRNKGSPGIDGMTVEELTPYLREHWPAIREQLLAGHYQPSAVRRQLIPKSGGGMRQLGIPTVLDRFVQHLLVTEGFPAATVIRVVLDNLRTHTWEALYETFPAEEARHLVRTLEFHYTPKHGSWLNIAEIELSVLSRTCLARRLATPDILAAEVTAYQTRRNAAAQPIEWTFTCDKARLKLHRLYPSNPL